MLKLWICEQCGISWDLHHSLKPLRDAHGRVICAPCLSGFNPRPPTS